MAYITTYDNLRVTSLTPEFHERTCNYWYTVTNGGMAHTAYTKREHLLQWLVDRGLELAEELPEPGMFSTQRVIGAYRTASTMDAGEFDALEPVIVTRGLSNGRYTMQKIVQDADGIRTVWSMNPNCERVEYDYFESRALVG